MKIYRRNFLNQLTYEEKDGIIKEYEYDRNGHRTKMTVSKNDSPQLILSYTYNIYGD